MKRILFLFFLCVITVSTAFSQNVTSKAKINTDETKDHILPGTNGVSGEIAPSFQDSNQTTRKLTSTSTGSETPSGGLQDVKVISPENLIIRNQQSDREKKSVERVNGNVSANVHIVNGLNKAEKSESRTHARFSKSLQAKPDKQ